jgi:DNA-binding MarR family transcriptional regulator
MKRKSSPAPSPTDDFQLEGFLPYQVNVLATRLSQSLADVYEARFGLGIPEWRVLAHLAANAKVSVREIYERVSMDKVKVSRAAANLEAAGHLSKQVNASDRRLVELQLTASGRKLFASIAPLALAYEKDVLSCLSDDEQHSFRTILEKLLLDTARR